LFGVQEMPTPAFTDGSLSRVLSNFEVAAIVAAEERELEGDNNQEEGPSLRSV
jgi:hypothetical protein